MNNLKAIEEAVSNAFCDRRVNFAGIVERTRSRNGSEMVDVLRKVTHERGFQPVVWDGSVLAFITIGDISFNTSRRGIGQGTLVVISNSYGDHINLIANLDKYDFPEISLSLDSQGIYDSYFATDDNKPFQGFAFSISFTFSDDASLCCQSFTINC